MMGKRRSVLDAEFLGIQLKYWLIAVICWILMGICIYLMFILSPLVIDLVLSTLSTIFGLTSVITLFMGASKKDLNEIRLALRSLENTVRECFLRQEDLLRQILEELKSLFPAH